MVLDQPSKLWLLFFFDIGHRDPVQVTPILDLVLAWNIGISFGWLHNQFAQLALMAVKALAVITLAIWMARSRTLLATLALGFVGGAMGTASTATAQWSILPCFTSRSAEKP